VGSGAFKERGSERGGSVVYMFGSTRERFKSTGERRRFDIW
jgi:hypothetical protein